MASNIVQWLERLGLDQYSQVLTDNRIDLDVLPELTEADLEKLDIPLGDRKRLLRAIAALSGSPSTDEQVTLGSPAPPPAAAEAERRQLTVLFTDLVGSTALASKLDPEDMREVLRAYQDACAGVITRYDGYVAKFMGDGVFAYFGYPRAHEDDTERAINAGLGIVEAVEALAHDLRVRIGIATGTVAVGDLIGEGASEETAVVGEAPNLAARLQELAKPNTVVIGERTHALVGELFETENLGKHELKGFAEALGAWVVVRRRPTESRFEATRGKHLTELVGRDEEMEILLRRWEWAKAGEGQVVLISGEPGIGKSRLATELQGRLADEAHFRLRYQCSPYHVNSALYPVINQLERAARFETGDSSETKLEKLEALLSLSGQPIEDAAPLIASLLSLPIESRYRPVNVSPLRKRELTLNALVDQLTGLAKLKPVLFVFEDAQWIDPTTLEMLELTVEHVTGLAVLALVTHRPEFDAPWIGHPHVTQMSLRRLGTRDCSMMVNRVAAQGKLPKALREKIALQTDGVPLFVEELTKSLLESPLDSPGTTVAIDVPATLQESLQARLDRLGSAKEVAQIGATLGREFQYEHLAAVCSLDEASLRDALKRLVQSELAFCRGAPPYAAYTFKHALVQDTAYRSLLRKRRVELHGRIAETLEKRFPESVANQPEILAHHYAEAGLTEQAVEHWHKAGERAVERSADVEAVTHCNRALELIGNLPDTGEHARKELDICVTLGSALLSTKGNAAPEVKDVYARAQRLCQEIEDTDQTFTVWRGLYHHHFVRGELPTAWQLAEDYFQRAKQDPAHRMDSYLWRGMVLYCRGEFEAALGQLEQCLQLDDPRNRRADAFLFESTLCRSFIAHALWNLGFPDQALKRTQEAVTFAADLSHPFSLASAHNYAAMHHQFRRDPEGAGQHASAAVELCTERDFAYYLAWGTILLGWAQAELERSNAGLARIREGLSALRATGAGLRVPYYLSLLAEECGHTGKVPDGLQLLDEAVSRTNEHGEHWRTAELHRLRGELLLKQTVPDNERAADCFRTAIEIARQQQAKSLELRAVTRLARLRGSQDKNAEACDELAAAYSWFTEGFDTADLKEAGAVLDELG